jgi:hypothetical protein
MPPANQFKGVLLSAGVAFSGVASNCIFLSLLVFFSGIAGQAHAAEAWTTDSDRRSTVHVAEVPTGGGHSVTEVQFSLVATGDPGWVSVGRKMTGLVDERVPVCFRIKAGADCDLEIKLIDSDGGVFGRRLPLKGAFHDFTEIVIYRSSVEYWWGGKNDQFNGLAALQLAFSGAGPGKVWLREVQMGRPGQKASFPPAGPELDLDRDLPGIGFRQRRDAKLNPEDPLVLEWLKQLQDARSPGVYPLPSTETSNEAQTFNNALVAMAFILKGERARAERILDFYDRATKRSNADKTLQNFFFQGEARGFFQHVRHHAENSRPALHDEGADRWMGDMAWLLIACKHYEAAFDSPRYARLEELLKGLLISWFTDSPDGHGGYVRHGWRKGDSRLHEDGGHPEGNIDCHVAFRLCGEEKYAAKIRAWLDWTVRGTSLPLDLYSWRVLAYGPSAARLLDIPEHDLRFRKTLQIEGRPAAGFYHGPDRQAQNVWLDGSGHMACAFLTCGDRERGNFYANQLDAFLVESTINGVKTRTLPYAANTSGDYAWVNPQEGFISAAAWHIFARNAFNPFGPFKRR